MKSKKRRKPVEKVKGIPVVRLVNPDGKMNIVRIGLKRRAAQDIFHALLRKNWLGLALSIAGFIIISNLIFAFVYFELGEVIENAHNFTDDFFFSVETMATVGYGYMRPIGNMANLMASIEAFFGLLTFAVIAGLIFAKFSKPTAKIMFSKSAIITIRNGRKALMFRMANERNNQIIDANLRASMMRTERTQEGEMIRSFSDMRLVRSSAPIFALSFTAVHFIDEDSPLYGESPESLLDQDIEIVVTFNGVDEVFSQIIYARHSYVLNEIHWEHKFVDVISITPDGFRSLDFTKFHLTQKQGVGELPSNHKLV